MFVPNVSSRMGLFCTSREDKGRHASVGLGGNVAQSLKDGRYLITICDI